MDKKYIAAIDFGHGETAAWIVPLYENSEQKFSEKEGNALSLKKANNEKLRNIYSVIYTDSEGNFSLDNVYGNVIGEFKKRVSELRNEPNKFNAYKAFIKEIYKRLLSMNDELQSDSEGNTNFYLCIACPTKWSENDRKEYLSFFNEALSEFKVEVLWVINESDAAFFSHGSVNECADKCVLIIDYGSSTIDYTVMDHNKKISDDRWSNAYLGASNIEESILAKYESQDDYQQAYKNTDTKLNEIGMDFHKVRPRLKFELRREKEHCVTESYYPAFNFIYNMIGICTPVGKESDWKENKSKYLFEYSCDLDTVLSDYKAAVLEDFRNLARRISENIGNRKIDSVVLSGGASLMPWVREYVEEVFNPQQVIHDNMASFVVAKGAALYARKQMEAYKMFMDKIMAHDYAQIYEQADRQATSVATEKLWPELDAKLRKSNITGSQMRQETISFIEGLNSKNTKYCRFVKDEICHNVSIAVAKDIKDTIKDVFAVDRDVNDMALDITPQVMDYRPEYFKPDYKGYKTVSEWIKIKIFFTWDRPRTDQERDKIIATVKGRIPEFSKKNTYDSSSLKQCSDDIKNQAAELASKVFYDYQLFQTTFKA